MRFAKQHSLWLTGLALSLLLLAAGGDGLTKESKDGMDVYFRDSAIESLARQELAVYRSTDAGESKKIDRSFPDAPPQIPHTVEDMLPITGSDNECLECHDPSNAIEKDDVPLPKTHFKQVVMGKGDKGEAMVWVVKGYEQAKEVVGSRYNCTMCHFAQADNARTIGNQFTPIAGRPTQ